MLKWQYVYVHFNTPKERFEVVCMPDGSGEVEIIDCPDDMTADQFFEVTLAKMGLEGWELAAAYKDNFYSSGPSNSLSLR